MNTRINKTILLITLMVCLATAVYSAVGTFTFRTSGASDTTEVVDLRYPQKVPEDSSVTTDSIMDGSITNDKLAEPISVANGGTGATTAAAGLAALGGASLNGSSTVNFSMRHAKIGLEKTFTYALSNIAVGASATIDFTFSAEGLVLAETTVGAHTGGASAVSRFADNFYAGDGAIAYLDQEPLFVAGTVPTFTVVWTNVSAKTFRCTITNTHTDIAYTPFVSFKFLSLAEVTP